MFLLHMGESKLSEAGILHSMPSMRVCVCARVCLSVRGILSGTEMEAQGVASVFFSLTHKFCLQSLAVLSKASEVLVDARFNRV